MVELKPCPFCGEKNVHHYREKLAIGHTYKVVCSNCYAEIYRADQKYAFEAWNRRSDNG